MIVRYVRERGYGEGKDPSLTLDKEYLILGMKISLINGIHEISLQSDRDKFPSVWRFEFFNITNPRIPEGWCFEDVGNGYFNLKPEEFSGNFWETYFDSTPEEEERARQIFTNVLLKIKRFHDRWDL